MPTIFISYSHDDEIWRKQIETQLRILKLNSKGKVGLDVWSDKQLEVGEEWEPKLHNIMEKAEVAVLVVTSNFMASEYVRHKELPYLEKRYQKTG